MRRCAHVLLIGGMALPLVPAPAFAALHPSISACVRVSVYEEEKEQEDEAFKALKLQLRDPDRYERHKAVKGLAQLATEEAWQLLLESLADPYGRVSDQAQLELAKLPTNMQPQLFGKAGLAAKSDWVPLRAAEILGRLPQAAAPSEFVAALKHKDPDVRRSLLWSIERLSERKLFSAETGELIAAVANLAKRDKDELVRAQALVTLRDLDEAEARALLAEFRVADFIPMRVAAAELLDLVPQDAFNTALQAALTDKAPVVRLRAYESLAKREDLAAVRALVGALESETVLRSSWNLVSLLRELSGLKYGLDARSWQQWLAQLPEDWTKADKHVPEQLGGEKTASFVGMPVISQRVAFLIDFSGSMWKEVDGKVRKERVDVEMRRVLEGLDAQVAFNIHPFYNEPLRWQKKLTQATPKNIAKALEYFEDCRANGTGDFWAAAMEAMRDPEVDTLMVLTDGAPSGGRRWHLELMRDIFQHENRFRGVALDALLFETSKGLTRTWTEMCENSGGRCQAVDL